MLKKELKNIVVYLLAVLILFTASLVGCGETGSGNGRQTLPGENPFGPIYTGTGTGTGTTTQTSTGTDTDTSLTVKQAFEIGYAKMLQGNFEAALQAFTMAIYDPLATPAQKQEAYSGRGWAKAHLTEDKGGGVIASIPDLKKASNMNPGADGDLTVINESKLGYALALIQLVVSGGEPDKIMENLTVSMGIINSLLLKTSWNGEVVREKYKDIYVSSPGARAMLALAYDLHGEPAQADYHIGIAIGQDPSDANVQNAKNTIDVLRGNI